MSACAKSGRWKDALAVFEKMRDVSRPGDLKGPEGVHGVVGSEGEGEEEWDGSPQEEESGVDEGEAEGEGETEAEAEAEAEVDEGEEDDDTEGEGLFRSMRGIANRVTFNTLIEALGQGGQAILVDELYKEAVDSGAVTPLRSFDQKGLIDLHGHSAHMAVAAIRYTFEYLLQKDAEGRDHEGRRRRIKELTVIVGKGGKLASVIQRELTDEFRPPVRSYVSKVNSGRLLLSEKDIVAWLNYHRRT
jgi:pentatricopeptide repeat protein